MFEQNTNKQTQLTSKATGRSGRGPNIPIEVKEFTWEMSARTHGPKEIHDLLERMAERGAWPKDVPLPGLRAIQELVKKRPAIDQTAPWSLATDQTSEPRVVLDSLAALIRRTEGRLATIPQGVAALIVQVWRCSPDLTPFQRWILARRFAERQHAGASTADLDALLAFAPWRDGAGGWNAYDRAFLNGWIQRAPLAVIYGLKEEDWIEERTTTAADKPEEPWWERSWREFMSVSGVSIPSRGAAKTTQAHSPVSNPVSSSD